MLSNRQKEAIKQTEHFVYHLLKEDASGHDWWHIQRVRNLAETIAAQEKEAANPFIYEMAALLHDVADEKINRNSESGEKILSDWLHTIKLEKKEKEAILEIILNISYKGGTNKTKLASIEGKIVQDADRLDALGAIGIARTMAYTGARGRLIHDPDASYSRENLTLEQYRSDEGTAVMHFYEKLFKLKDLMNTSTGRKIASKRHDYMENYLKEFYEEWEGNR